MTQKGFFCVNYGDEQIWIHNAFVSNGDSLVGETCFDFTHNKFVVSGGTRIFISVKTSDVVDMFTTQNLTDYEKFFVYGNKVIDFQDEAECVY